MYVCMYGSMNRYKISFYILVLSLFCVNLCIIACSSRYAVCIHMSTIRSHKIQVQCACICCMYV